VLQVRDWWFKVTGGFMVSTPFVVAVQLGVSLVVDPVYTLDTQSSLSYSPGCQRPQGDMVNQTIHGCL